ncbi:hypothetical protein B0H14DRAFT_2650540 [Mycena olivaceomarginata]|nr:hypothetical protein B0H14DRAFT_2650540 [Mycena olivaceomarginata]
MRDAEDDGGHEGEGEGEDKDDREIQMRSEEAFIQSSEKMSNVKLVKKSREWLNLWLSRMADLARFWDQRGSVHVNDENKLQRVAEKSSQYKQRKFDPRYLRGRLLRRYARA